MSVKREPSGGVNSYRPVGFLPGSIREEGPSLMETMKLLRIPIHPGTCVNLIIARYIPLSPTPGDIPVSLCDIMR